MDLHTQNQRRRKKIPHGCASCHLHRRFIRQSEEINKICLLGDFSHLISIHNLFDLLLEEKKLWKNDDFFRVARQNSKYRQIDKQTVTDWRDKLFDNHQGGKLLHFRKYEDKLWIVASMKKNRLFFSLDPRTRMNLRVWNIHFLLWK